MTNKIKRFYKQLSCAHTDADLIRWHWTHGPDGNEPTVIEAEYRCKDCGKVVYMVLYGQRALEWSKVMGYYKEAK